MLVTVALLELHYFPSIQFFTKLVGYPVVVLEQHENYQKGSYRNRTHIATASGLQRLSVPLQQGKNQQLPIREVAISFKEPWHREHQTAIRSAYGKAPFFEFYGETILSLLDDPAPTLFDWNFHILQKLLRLLQIEVDLRLSNSFLRTAPQNGVDLRNVIHPKPHRSETDTNFRVPHYRQVFEEKHGFLPNLSILDLLFCMGPQSILYLEAGFQPTP